MVQSDSISYCVDAAHISFSCHMNPPITQIDFKYVKFSVAKIELSSTRQCYCGAVLL